MRTSSQSCGSFITCVLTFTIAFAVVGMVRLPLAAAQSFNVAEIQEMLVWTSHYDGLVNGNFSPATRAAVIAFQNSIGGKGDGQLTGGEIDRLKREGAVRKQKAGFEVI